MNVIEFRDKIKKAQSDDVASFNEVYGKGAESNIIQSVYNQLVSSAGMRGVKQPIEITGWFASSNGDSSTGYIPLRKTPRPIVEKIKANLTFNGFIVTEYPNSLDINWEEYIFGSKCKGVMQTEKTKNESKLEKAV